MVREVRVTAEPAAVAGLAVGTRYGLQNQGSVPVYADTDAAAPANSAAPGIELPPGPLLLGHERLAPWGVELKAGESLYLWTRQGEANVVWWEALS